MYPMTPWVLRLIIANVVMYFLTASSPLIYRALAFVPAAALVRPWTMLTYMFLHANFGHIFFNMLALFFFGPRLEDRLGGKNFMLLYLASGIMGAVLSFLLAPYAAVVGASGAVFGVLYGFAKFWPDEPIYLMMLFPIPARILVIGFAVLSIWSGFSDAADGVAHFAHLGGFVGGWAYLWYWGRKRGYGKKQRERPSTLEVVTGKLQREQAAWSHIRPEELHEINREEVERIQRKIDADGAGSLTTEERTFMNRMSGNV